MSQGVYGSSRIDARGPSKNQPSPSPMKAISPASVPTLPSHTNGRKYIDPAGQEFYPGGAGIAEIINIIKSNFNGSDRCWYKVPQSVRDMWFREFEKKFWWYPENHSRIRDLFEAHGCAQLNHISSQARANQNVKQFRSAEKSKNNSKSQVNEKIPFGGPISSSKLNNIKGKYYPRMDEEQSSQSSIEDTCEDNNSDSQNWNVPAEVKEVMDTVGKEFHGKVKKSFEAVNRVWIQRVESLERERVELKNSLQLCVQQLQNYQNRQNDNIALLKGLSEKLIIKGNSSSPPPHHPKVVAFQPPPPPPHHPKVAAFNPPPPPPPPAHNPKVSAFRPTPPQYHPNFSTFPTPQPPPNTSGYGFQGMQSLGLGNGYSNKDDVYEDDDFSEEYSDF